MRITEALGRNEGEFMARWPPRVLDWERERDLNRGRASGMVWTHLLPRSISIIVQCRVKIVLCNISDITVIKSFNLIFN